MCVVNLCPPHLPFSQPPQHRRLWIEESKKDEITCPEFGYQSVMRSLRCAQLPQMRLLEGVEKSSHPNEILMFITSQFPEGPITTVFTPGISEPRPKAVQLIRHRRKTEGRGLFGRSRIVTKPSRSGRLWSLRGHRRTDIGGCSRFGSDRSKRHGAASSGVTQDAPGHRGRDLRRNELHPASAHGRVLRVLHDESARRSPFSFRE